MAAVRVREATKHARHYGASGSFTAQDVAEKRTAQNDCCYYCGCDVSENYHIEHFIPLAKGGSNNAENIVISCRSCNQSKQNLMPDEWAERRQNRISK